MVRTSYSTSDEWRRALECAALVKAATQDLRLDPRMEWLRQVLNESMDQLRAAVLWAAAQDSLSDRTSAALRHVVVAADAARSNAALASYFLSFLTHKDLMPVDTAANVTATLREIETAMDALSLYLRDELGSDPYAPSTNS